MHASLTVTGRGRPGPRGIMGNSWLGLAGIMQNIRTVCVSNKEMNDPKEQWAMGPGDDDFDDDFFMLSNTRESWYSMKWTRCLLEQRLSQQNPPPQ